MSLPREGSRDTSEGIIISKYPDVCKSPVCPVPYTIVAFQSDDANTAASVRMTGLRAHKQSSIVTQCSGDEPGVGLGVKSGTVKSVCHRKEHSSTVRIEGEWATRHGDEWWMNNRNTIGKLVYPGSTESFKPTPPLQYAYLDTGTMNDASPETATKPDKPAPKPEPPKPGSQYWKRIKSLAGRMKKGGQIGVLLGLGAEARDSWNRYMDLVQKGPPLTDFQGNLVDSETIKRDIMRQLGVKNDAELQELLKRSQEVEDETDTPPGNGETPGRVKVTGRDKRRNCRLRPYKEGCADALPYSTPHHVVADRVFRRPGSDALYPGGIPHADGLTLCVDGGTPVFSRP
jgi:Domain of unknown function (DUF4150)